ncbi:MAG: flagellar basal body P-ring formation protein FlgA, partial [Candidatus Omnitrophica bacterium]|nr:flagellar basal body P-ring formation protein FlgA [Candidatus Omnitrophota bacterium]
WLVTTISGQNRSFQWATTEKIAKAVIAGQDLETGQIIKSQDLVKDQVKILDSSDMPDLVLDPETIIGARLRKAIKSGIPIRQSDLEWIPLRKRGESVTLVKQVGNVRLSIHATLQEDLLRVGQEVKVKMKKSKKEAVGRLLEDGTVLLLSEKR